MQAESVIPLCLFAPRYHRLDGDAAYGRALGTPSRVISPELKSQINEIQNRQSVVGNGQ